LIKNYVNESKYCEFSLSNNRKVLLLAIKGKDSKGSKDIYVSFYEADGKWSEPLNLGSDINTASIELTPFLASDGHTLYFSSYGYSGYGDADMYVSRRLDDTWTNWTEPMNLGPTFNSSVWDASYTIDAKGEYAYFVSYKNSIGRSADIFRAKLPQSVKPEPVALVHGTVYNSKTKEPIGGEITYEILATGKEAGAALAEPGTGKYKITLPLNQTYAFWANAKGFLAIDENISLKNLHEYKVIKKDLYLTPIEVGQTIRLNNLFFVQSTDSLLQESFPELNRMAKVLDENPSLEIVLEGHTDIGGSPIKNMELSKQRVQVIKLYLMKKGISGNRIGMKAFGSTQPITRLRDEVSKKLNRRVEFRIVKD
jgi:outer membrane protein OmpA-like peptidoglycan-associated protein